jgi:hypothetical protein
MKDSELSEERLIWFCSAAFFIGSHMQASLWNVDWIRKAH